ncbi:MAG: hypothetical protein FJ087_05975, partial [Deltaproteobacteria bacterium]|nr:hypothetical protein [Deltaproteobacteria bacterium]
MQARVGRFGLVGILVAIGCNEIPVGNIRSSFVLNQQEIREKGQPAKLDILWVVDDSPSMC